MNHSTTNRVFFAAAAGVASATILALNFLLFASPIA